MLSPWPSKNWSKKLSENSNKSSQLKKEIESIFLGRASCVPDVFFYKTTDSTNTRAKLYAENRDGAEHAPAIFFSHAQDAGRGTRGRTFESPEGGVYISFLIYPDSSAVSSLSLTTYAAVAVCRAINRLTDKISPKIKWVNDITVNDKKLAGILTEGKIEDGKTKYAIVGIGINVKRAIHSPEVEAIMTSLSQEGVELSEDELAIALTEEFFLGLSDIGSEKILSRYRSLSTILGKEISITDTYGTRRETAIDINADFSLTTRDGDGCVHRYISADVSVSTNKK